MADANQLYGGRYQVERKLARGGMADVYLARDTMLDRPVALKVLFPEFATDRTFVERFRREAQSAANLNHPNIVSVFDWGEADGTYFIVMELIDGRSLAQILREEGPFSPDRAADIVIDVAAALGFAHRHGVIHRDVKPGNVLISPNGHVKVTDFGIARAVSTQENLTQTGTVMGTAAYFSPEQARGEAVDRRSDLYSLGVVLYELLVGGPPFSGDSPVTVAYKHVSEPPTPPRVRNPAIPAAIEAVTMRALAKNPANRYASADELIADLRRFREGVPVQAEGVLPVEDATMAVAAATPPTVAVRRPESTTVQRRVEEWTPPPRRNRGLAVGVGLAVAVVLAALAFLALELGSDGGGDVEVPDVIGETEEAATEILEGEGFTVRSQPDPDTDEEPGTVIGQDPRGGREAPEGSTVLLTVATESAEVEVPSVVGLTRQEAEEALGEDDLVPVIVLEPDDGPPDRVLRQDPAAGEVRTRGSSVRLTVSTEEEEIEVPDVVGSTCAEAQRALFARGLFGTCEPAQARVTAQRPAAGDTVESGSTVELTATVPTTTTTSTTTTTTTTTTSSTSSTSTSSTTSTPARSDG